MNKSIYAFCMIFCLQANQLKKIYVHHAPESEALEQAAHLELTKAVFYFAEQPEMHQLAHDDKEQSGWKHETYFFTTDAPDTVCNGGLPDLQKKTAHYQLACTRVAEPRNGLRLQVCYDPQKIMCVRESFDAITSDKGVVIRLINKKLLDEMRGVPQPLLQLAHTMPHRVVIDYGHGGHDPGAIGLNGIMEKDITMQVGQKLAHFLREKGCVVFLTRDADHFVSLPQRTCIINAYRPDAYISIHANSSTRSSAQGIETYCLNTKLFRDFTCHDAAGSQFQQIVDQRYAKSRAMANQIHACMLNNLVPFSVQDRHVKQAVSQILLGANVPGILVELGFVTHLEESLRLAQADYQERLAVGICEGLMAYLQTV